MAGRRLRADDEPTPVLDADRRVQALQAVRVEPQTPEDFVREIARLWGRAQGAFLDIGRLLILAKEKLPHGSYIEAVEGNLPFTRRTAHQLREAARWVLEREGALRLEDLPNSYSTIYLLSTLEPPALQEAEQEGIIRPTLTRSELVEWRKRKSAGPSDQRAAIVQRIARLKRETARVAAELKEAEEQLRAIDAAVRKPA